MLPRSTPPARRGASRFSFPGVLLPIAPRSSLLDTGAAPPIDASAPPLIGWMEELCRKYNKPPSSIHPYPVSTPWRYDAYDFGLYALCNCTRYARSLLVCVCCFDSCFDHFIFYSVHIFSEMNFFFTFGSNLFYNIYEYSK